MVKSFIVKPDLTGWKQMSGYVQGIHKSGKSVTITVDEGEKKRRSLTANGLQQVWYKQIADKFGNDITFVSSDCKIRFGVSILAAAQDIRGEMIRNTLDKIGYQWMTYEEKLKAVKDLPVTRIMNKSEHKDFLDKIQIFYAKHGLELDSNVEI